MSIDLKLEKLKNSESLEEVSHVLGYKTSLLSYILYKLPEVEKYKKFHIPKKGGDSRLILAPTDRLRTLQKKLSDILYHAIDPNNDDGKIKEISKNKTHAFSHGFTKERSIITNAKLHKNKRYVLNFDLQEFFPSINFGRVRGALEKDKRLSFSPKTANILAQIACHNNSLPQGSPCSPILSNIIGNILDVRMAKLAKEYKLTYTRYVDDITFSTNLKDFPEAIAYISKDSPESWRLGERLTTEVNRSGFEINPNKTRMQLKISRQSVTGLITNKKINVPREYWKETRAMCHSFFKNLHYYKKANNENIKIESINPLIGRINYILHVKSQSTEKSRDTEKPKSTEKSTGAAQELCNKLFFFDKFITNKKTTIITEGKTDIIYLKCAIKSLKCEGLEEGKLNFIKHQNKQNFEDLGLEGGTESLKIFITKYQEEMKNIEKINNHKPLSPVIITADNDHGIGNILSHINGIYKKINKGCEISYQSTDPYYHIFHNLYLIKTPPRNDIEWHKNSNFPQDCSQRCQAEKGGCNQTKCNIKSCIEDLFEEKILSTQLEGKMFDPNSKKNAKDNTYGKTVFATKVIIPQKNEINFSAFQPILTAISAINTDYQNKIQSITASSATSDT